MPCSGFSALHGVNPIFLKKIHFNVVFLLGSKARKVRRKYKKVLVEVTFTVTFFYRTFILLGSPRK